MTKKFVDCFLLMSSALSLRGGQKLPEIGRPNVQELTATKINISLSLYDMKILSHNDLEIEITGVLNQNWVDPRLGANIKTRKLAVAGQIWKPKILNINGENKLGNNEDMTFWRGFGDEGNILLSEKIAIGITCSKNYRRFPFDVQMCQIKFGSFRFPQEEVLLLWNPLPVELTTEVAFNEFRLIDSQVFTMFDVRQAGNFSVAVFQLYFKRSYEYYIHCIMFPVVILSVLNYLPFWFCLSKRSNRLFINLGIFVCLVNFCYISLSLTSVIYYFKAIDVFVLFFTSFALITLIETVFIDSLCSLEECHFHLRKFAFSKEYPNIVLLLELIMKLGYPILFLVFLIFYCWYYF